MDLELSAEEKSLLEQIKTNLTAIGDDRGKLIPILQLVQQKFAYLPAEAIHLVADHLAISSSESAAKYFDRLPAESRPLFCRQKRIKKSI